MENTRAQFLRDLNKAFADHDIDYIAKFITDDIEWRIVGEDLITGKANFQKSLKQMENEGAFKLDIDNIIIHNDRGIVEGSMTSKEGNAYAFCDIYTFAKTDVPMITAMTSYVVELEKKPAKA
ncbi:MAG: nuclear transport factor 2 family protein [Bacteroidota bacterium]